MDPLSVAVSRIAVVSLAIQLVDQIRETNRFLRDVDKAPKELSRLVVLLKQLHCLLDGITAVLQRLRLVGEDIDVSAIILVALQGCDVQIKTLDEIVRSACTMHGSRTWLSLKLASKKRDIKEIEKPLHREMTILQTAMTLNIMQTR
jgi:hypothetical protein